MTADVSTPSFGESLGESIRRNGRELSARWLSELMAILPVEAQAIFPTTALLDHVPELLDQIGQYVASPATAEIHANTLVLAKAREFGQLRHQQQASVHQLLREYEILGRVLETFVADETERLGLTPAPRTCLDVAQRINRALYALMQTTVDTFVSEYMATVDAHTAKLRSFNQMLSHELRNPLNTLQFAAELLSRRTAGETGSGVVSLIVRDNGLGIPPEHRQAIFQRSFRAHAERDDELGNDGFGMGLTIVQECLRELNGSIDVESTPGEGSRFFVRLPLQTLE